MGEKDIDKYFNPPVKKAPAKKGGDGADAKKAPAKKAPAKKAPAAAAKNCSETKDPERVRLVQEPS